MMFIFVMQPYLDPIRKTTSIFLKMEDDLHFFLKKEDDLTFFLNERRPQKKLCNQKLLKVKTIIFLKMEDVLLFLKKDDDLKKIENGR